MFPDPYLETSTSSNLTLDTVASWVSSCRQDHDSCIQSRNAGSWCPTRLIDIGGYGDSNWSLFLRPDDGSSLPGYATLSYRWGSNSDFKLTRSKLETGFHGRIDDLPRTFREAVVVVRRLSVRYLWIDRLCIIQDSQEDWRRESMTMKDVYANSICNIAASASTDPEGGLFRIRNPDDAASGLVKGSLGMSPDTLCRIYEDKYAERHLFSASLHRRGWVFQERILAPRVVYFANDQVFWECFNELKCERFPHGIPLGHSSKRLLRKWMDLAHSNGELELCSDRVFFHWSDLVNSYSRCELTNESDRLIALSGLVQIFQDFTGDEYLAGLWRQNLREHLAWNTTTLAPGSVSRSMHPSWSWASVTGPISTYEAVHESRQHFAIVDVQMQSSKLDSDDHAISGSIMINGIMLQATCYLTEERSGNVRISSLLADFPMFTDVLDHGIENGSTVACLVMGTRPKESRTRVIDTNMSLMLLASVSSQPNTYRRIGYKWVQEHLWKDKLGLALTEEGIEITGEGPKRLNFWLV